MSELEHDVGYDIWPVRAPWRIRHTAREASSLGPDGDGAVHEAPHRNATAAPPEAHGPTARLIASLDLDRSEWFAGHYPGWPILPGSYLCGALVQLANAASASPPGALRMEELVSCRLMAPVGPGDRLHVQLDLDAQGSTDGSSELRAELRATEPAVASANDRGREVAQVTMKLRQQAAEQPRLAPEPIGRGAQAAPILVDEEQVGRILPHRDPVLLVGSAAIWPANGRERARLVASWPVRPDGPWLCASEAPSGHPAILPRHLVVESFCQACGLLRGGLARRGASAGHADGAPPSSSPAERAAEPGRTAGADVPEPTPRRIPVLARILRLRLSRDVVAGERIEHHVQLLAESPSGAVFSGHVVASGELVATVDRVVAGSMPVGRRS